jgi:phage shock protein A
MLKHAIRDMELTLRAAVLDAAKVVAHEQLLRRQLNAARAEATRERKHAVAAIAAGDHERARGALFRQHDQEALAAALAAPCEETGALRVRLRRQLDALRWRLHDARMRQQVLAARHRAALVRRRLLGAISTLPLGDETAADFERMARKVDETEAEADGLAELAGAPLLGADAAPAQEAAAWVERELQALKDAVGGQRPSG